MRTAVEHAGAERGVLLLMRWGSLRIAAEATTKGDAFAAHLRDARMEPTVLPESVVQYVARIQEGVLLDDAGTQGCFGEDEYITRTHARSIVCIPLLKQARLLAVLYLENKLAASVFTSARIAVLDALASAALTDRLAILNSPRAATRGLRPFSVAPRVVGMRAPAVARLGMERQWRQRMTGLRTNGLVAVWRSTPHGAIQCVSHSRRAHSSKRPWLPSPEIRPPIMMNMAT